MMRTFTQRRFATIALAVASMVATLTAQHYRSDTKYTPTSLAGWHVLGDADWRGQGGGDGGRPQGAPRGGVRPHPAVFEIPVFARLNGKRRPPKCGRVSRRRHSAREK